MLFIFGVDSAAGIDDIDMYLVVAAVCVDFNAPAAFHGFIGVFNQIHDGLIQAQRIGHNGRQIRFNIMFALKFTVKIKAVYR